MKRSIIHTALILVTLTMTTPALAAVEPDYDPSKPRVTTAWYGMMNEARKQADMAFITGMRPHHAGALTMSNQYLAHPDARNATLKQLARGITHNQTFEITMLDTVQGHLDDLSFASKTPVHAQVATGGLAQKLQFRRAPAPGPLDRWAGSRAVTTEDVRFAKAMIIHHEGALTMAQDYLDNANAINEYLRLMCLDILRDQTMEIDLMKSIVARYAGNPDDVRIDPSMVHGMDGMTHSTPHQH